MIQRILQIGIPNSVENSMFQLGKIVLLSLISGFGTVAITANAVSNSVAAFAILPGQSIGMALVTVVSQCVGARDYWQARYYTKKLHLFTYAAMMVSLLSMWFCRIMLVFLLGKYMGYGLFGVWVAMVLDWCVRSVLSIIRYLRGKWEQRKIFLNSAAGMCKMNGLGQWNF